jgi:hypothetical protein
MWIIFFMSAGMILSSIFIFKLHISRNFFFLLLLLQSFLYLNLSPSLLIFNIDNDLKEEYVWIQLYSLVFFTSVFIMTYVYKLNKMYLKKKINISNFVVSKKYYSLISFFVLVLSCISLYVKLSRDILFARIGSIATALFVSLSSSYLWLISRLFDKYVLFFFALLVYIWLTSSHKERDIFPILSITTIILVYGLFFLINSRIRIVFFAVVILGVMSLHTKSNLFKKKINILPFLLIFLLLLYSFNIATNIRMNYTPETGIKLDYFIPKRIIGTDYNSVTTLANRTNGIDLIARANRNLTLENLAFGKAWSVPILLATGPFIFKKLVNEYKLKGFTAAKNFIMVNYTDLTSSDYIDCMLTDAYINFWIFGFIIVGFVLGTFCAYIDKNLRYPESSRSIVISLFLVNVISLFEGEFITIFMGIFQGLPFLLFILLINPLKRINN